MKLKLTEEELLGRWRVLRAIDPLRSDVEIELTGPDDGTVAADALYRSEMREWYLRLLDEADLSHLHQEDIADKVSLRLNGDGTGTITLPEGCRRVAGVKLTNWSEEVELTAPDSETARRQQSAYTRAGKRHPVVIWKGNRLHLYGTGKSSEGVIAIHRLNVVMEKSGTKEEPMIIDERDLEGVRSEGEKTGVQ